MPRSAPDTAPRPEVLAFLADIKEAPEEDTPRLIFADWLEENGDPRGEFMRAQCQLARLAHDDPRCKELRRREGELREQNMGNWLGRLPPGVQPKFRRGLLHLSVPYRSDVLLRENMRKWATTEAALWLEALTIGYAANMSMAQLATVLEMLPAVSLALSWSDYKPGSTRAVAFVQAPTLARVRELELSNNMLQSAGARALASAPNLARLRKLVLRSNQIDADGAQALATSPHLRELRVLDLYSNRIGAEGASALAMSPLLAQLTELNLAANGLGDTGAAIFLDARLPRFAKLDLSHNAVSAEVAMALRQRFGERVRL